MRGICKSCSQLLQTTNINKEEFKQLSQSFMQNAIIGKNILYASSPQELKRYMIFINSMKPYNLVIDGLNVAYAMRTKTEAGSLKPILDIVEEFHKKGQRVLVIGRIHMLWWSKKTMKLIQEKADTFFTKNISEDDPFLLHVTLMSGPQTYFISRDLMRNLKYKLIDPHLKNVFKTWQLSRQYLYKINKHKKTVELIEPISFEMKTQKSEEGWHIPFTCDTKLILPDSYSLPEKWICLKNKK
ncbi:PREDICTED: mitochondrial ribonuclease P protein 3 isoform X2 [Ceratosolen solmsi marchali]|uniref:Mitochondrial ribonuclease P protein 3 isoform X2 n=1 Tax=Ceratosolen solmsi marchali TaxID=326594 RepID=A0AAJ6YE43_9HYME|nr:PREDICTED: mitochondrial ribonuclease P protein 3 isoform X2 [Ceratosolen solmsi marchali]